LYLAEDLETCLWERFGDDILNPGSRVSRALWLSRTVSRVQAPALQLCDLADERTRRRAHVDLSALKHTDLAVPQAWGAALQRHPTSFDGLRYTSRFNDRACFALFERNDLSARLRASPVGDLGLMREGDDFLKRYGVALI
jgi:hypothetical protein